MPQMFILIVCYLAGLITAAFIFLFFLVIRIRVDKHAARIARQNRYDIDLHQLGF